MGPLALREESLTLLPIQAQIFSISWSLEMPCLVLYLDLMATVLTAAPTALVELNDFLFRCLIQVL